MIRASFSETVGGRDFAFALPIGQLRVLAAHEKRLHLLFERLSAEGGAALDDVEAILKAAMAKGEAEALIEVAGFIAATGYAMRILYLALSDDEPVASSKKAPAAPDEPTTVRPLAGAPTS